MDSSVTATPRRSCPLEAGAALLRALRHSRRLNGDATTATLDHLYALRVMTEQRLNATDGWRGRAALDHAVECVAAIRSGDTARAHSAAILAAVYGERS